MNKPSNTIVVRLADWFNSNTDDENIFFTGELIFQGYQPCGNYAMFADLVHLSDIRYR